MPRARTSGRALLLFFVSLLAGCSSASPSPADFADPDVAGRDANPDGVPYPTDHIGGNKRVGTRPGDRIPNFTFQGYVDGDRSRGLQTISLADYFDPTQKKYKVLHLEIAATWCSICASEADATVIAKEPLGAKGIAFVEIILAGPTQGSGPALEDVTGWMDRHKSNFTTAIDVRARRLGSIGITGDVMPWDVLVDTRTMEILDSAGGAPADVVQFDLQFLDFVNKYPPSY